jgi:hypothetical protein
MYSACGVHSSMYCPGANSQKHSPVTTGTSRTETTSRLGCASASTFNSTMRSGCGIFCAYARSARRAISSSSIAWRTSGRASIANTVSSDGKAIAWLGQVLALVTTVPAPIARALIGGLKHDIPAHDDELRALLPQRLLTFKEGVRAALDAERAHTVAARWTEGALMFRGGRHDYAFYAKRASGSAVARASPAAVWAVVTQLGGDTGYFYANALWRARAWIDWLLGGPGLSKGRRHPTELRVGDTIDYWTVLALDPPSRLTLNFGMKAPGNGVMEFEMEPLNERETRVAVTAYWHPAGVWGLLYWYAFVPVHRLLFRGVARAIARRAAPAATRDA